MVVLVNFKDSPPQWLAATNLRVLPPSSSQDGKLSKNLSKGKPASQLMIVLCCVCVSSGAMIAVGLKPTRDESRHWDALKGIVVSNRQDSSSTQPPVLQASHHPKDTSIIRHVSGYDYFEATDGVGPAPPSSLVRQSLQPTSLRQMSVQSYKTDKATGRNQAIRTELKPDLWKLAVNSIRASTKVSQD